MEDRSQIWDPRVMMVVCNSTPLIYLAAIGKFDLLRALYGQVLIPSAVYDEVVTQGAGRWGAAETAGASWIDRRSVADLAKVTSLQARLHGGESEVVVLAEELQADLVSTAATLSRQHGLLTTDAIILALMQAHQLTHLASHDAHFDRVPGIARYAPQ